MDPIEIDEFQAMKRYRRRRRRQFLLFLPISLVQCMAAAAFLLVLLALLLVLLSIPTWLSSMRSSLELILSVSVPNLAAASPTPACLFVVGNLIVVFLVGESRLLRSSSGVNEEHMQKISTMSLKEDFFLGEDLLGGEEVGRGGGRGSCDEEEEHDDSLNELKKRSEDLIARVTEQWRVEAKTILLGYQKATSKETNTF